MRDVTLFALARGDRQSRRSRFGRGGEWDEAFTYFQGAWTFVAAALQHRFAAGPIDWRRLPDLSSRMIDIDGDAARD
jgi:hypothetical protein